MSTYVNYKIWILNLEICVFEDLTMHNVLYNPTFFRFVPKCPHKPTTKDENVVISGMCRLKRIKNVVISNLKTQKVSHAGNFYGCRLA